MPFTDEERTYLDDAPIGRIATSSPTGQPDVAAVTFRLDGDAVLVGGYDLTRTIKYHNVLANGRASFVVDDLVTRDPWRPRGVKVRGPARVEGDTVGKQDIRIEPETIWSWGINPGGEPGKRQA
jgi:pyridoxamine 5'-phosphate oxidase family protein